jgi:uncharacterized protein YcsI (UPF0317 family)
MPSVKKRITHTGMSGRIMFEKLRDAAEAASRKVRNASSISSSSGTSMKVADEHNYSRAWRAYSNYRRLHGEPGYMNGEKS